MADRRRRHGTRRSLRASAIPAPLLVAGGALSVQFGAAAARTVFPAAGPVSATWLRLASAAVILLVLWRPHPAPLRPIGLLVVGYGASLAGMNLTFYEALSRLPLGAAVTVEFLGPLAVAIAGSRRRRDYALAALAALGILLLAELGGKRPLDPLGLLLAAVAGACWASYILVSSAVARRTTGAAPLAVATALAAVVLLPFGIGRAMSVSVSVVGLGCLVGLLSSVIPYSLELEALRRLPPRVFGVSMSLEPAVAALAGALVLGETLTLRQWLGLGCVISACAMASSWSRRPEPAEVTP